MRRVLLLAVFLSVTVGAVFIVMAYPVYATEGSGVAFEIHEDITTNQLGWGNNTSGISKIVETWKSFSDQRICTVKHKIATVGNPTDNLILSVYHDPSDLSAEPEGGIKIGEVSIPALFLPTSVGSYVSFDFNDCLQMVANGNYSFATERE